MEPKLFCGTGARTGAIIIYIGSGSTAPEAKLSFYEIFYYIVVSLEDARIGTVNTKKTCFTKLRNIYDITFVVPVQFLCC